MDTPKPLLKRDSPLSRIGHGEETMQLEDLFNKEGILLALCAGVGAYSWTHPALHGPLIWIGFIGGLIVCRVGTAKLTAASFTAPEN